MTPPPLGYEVIGIALSLAQKINRPQLRSIRFKIFQHSANLKVSKARLQKTVKRSKDPIPI
jgi:hypothetical protein